MLQPFKQAPETAELFGDLHPFFERLGSPDGLAALTGAAGALPLRQIGTLPELRVFLHFYHARILQPLELPAIHQAFNHAEQNGLRELTALDRQLAGEPLLQNFASASRLVGHAQLQRLRPLRDQRLVQRYLGAVERGEAQGWHTLVYGLTLAVYSLPLRQGLAGYAWQTTRGFIQSAARALKMSEGDSRDLLAEFSTVLPPAVEALLSRSPISLGQPAEF